MGKTKEVAPAVAREIVDAKGIANRLEVPVPGEGESIFVMAVHKSGSTLLNGIVTRLARRAQKPFLSIHDQLFRQGSPIHKAPAEVFEIWKRPGYTFGGIRSFNPLFETDGFRRDARKILLVRDPRDIATSLYFSLAKSHTMPGAGQLQESFAKAREEAQQIDVNEYILKGRADSVLNTMAAFTRLLGSQKLNVFRYEDVVYSKREWILELARIFEVRVPDPLMERMLKQFDVVPGAEDASKHVRQVKPGNFQKHLAGAAVQHIQNKYRELFDVYRYERV